MKTLAAVTSPPTSRRSTAPDQLLGAHERGSACAPTTELPDEDVAPAESRLGPHHFVLSTDRLVR
jgi:hypothetical protein